MYTYRDKIDDANDLAELQALLAEIESELTLMHDSPYMEEDSYRQQAHDLELILDYGRLKLEKMLS
jgi:hypothetical protein